MTDFKKQGRSDSKPATSSPSTSGAGISRSTERPRTSPLKRPISVEDVMREVDMPAELQRTKHTSIARFEQQRLSSAEPHLLQSTHVNKKPRREAQVKTSSDRLSLAAESKVQGDNHYTQLTQALQEGQQPSIVGRFQDPTQKKAAIDERFIYQRGKSTPPSYPEKARDLERMKTNHDLTDAQVAKEVKNAMRVSPLQYGTKEQQGSVATIANLIGISEQRRDPYMAFTSAQRIDYASAPQHSESPTTLFGKKKGKTNLAGTLPASGTGAKARFKKVNESLASGQDLPNEGPEREIYENITAQHESLMRAGFQQGTMNRMAHEGLSEKLQKDAASMRMRSSATRTAAMMTGQIPYNLRTLREESPPRDPLERRSHDDRPDSLQPPPTKRKKT